MSSPLTPKNEVFERTIDSDALVHRVDPGPSRELPYEFGGGRKKFWGIYQGDGFYDKPVSISGGVTTHLPDPDNNSTNYGM